MRIEKIVKEVTVYYYVETDAEIFPTFRTDGNGNWERAMGESWETWFSVDELEKLFREYEI